MLNPEESLRSYSKKEAVCVCFGGEKERRETVSCLDFSLKTLKKGIPKISCNCFV